MSDLSTYEGQANHYAAVKARLGKPVGGVKPVSRAMIPAEPRWAPVVTIEPPKRGFIVTKIEELTQPTMPVTVGMPDWKRITTEVAHKHGVRFQDILSDIRSSEVVFARQETVYRLHEELSLTWGQIGRHLNKDHTSALWGYRLHSAFLESGERGNKYKHFPPDGFWTPEKLEQAMRMRSRGMSYRAISEAFGGVVGEKSLAQRIRRGFDKQGREKAERRLAA
jgi:hypothetical protein